MTGKNKQEDYAEQISEIVRNFVQVWIKFESMLHSKLLELPNHSGGDNTTGG